MKTAHRTIARALLLTAAFTLTTQRLQAQTFPADDPVIQAIWEEGMGEGSRAHDLAQALLDSIGPRLMGSPAYSRSADWLLANYERWGIEAARQEYGIWTGWDRGFTHIDLLEPRVRTLEGTMLAWSPGTDGPVEGEVIALPNFAEAGEFEAWLPSVEGKFVAISFAEPTCREDQSWEDHATPESFQRMVDARDQARAEWQRSYGPLFMAASGARRVEEAGALGVLTARWSNGWGVDKIFAALTRQVPSVHLSCEDYSLVHRLASRGQGPRIRLDARSEFLGDVPAFNVVASIPGTELPDEYVLLSAHLDSWDGASGATDNGTGHDHDARSDAHPAEPPTRIRAARSWSGTGGERSRG